MNLPIGLNPNAKLKLTHYLNRNTQEIMQGQWKHQNHTGLHTHTHCTTYTALEQYTNDLRVTHI